MSCDYPTEFRMLPQYPGYRFGSNGSAWSCRRGRSKKTGWCKLQPGVGPGGYLAITLSVKGRPLVRRVHRLILEAFAEQDLTGMWCWHCNGNKTDNRITNLQWGPRKPNVAGMQQHEEASRSEQSSGPELPDNDVNEIRQLYLTGNYSYRELAVRYEVTVKTIRAVLWSNSWLHVPISESDRRQIRLIALMGGKCKRFAATTSEPAR